MTDESTSAYMPDPPAGTAPGRGRMAGRRVLVVGAGQDPHGGEGEKLPSGNGRAISALLAREGAAVACADIFADRAAETLAAVEAEGGRGVAIAADVSSEPDVMRMFDEATAAMGALDGLVANVGIGRGIGLEGTTVDDWDAVLGVNLRSHFLGCKHGIPRLPEGGAVVLVSSVAGLRPGSFIPAYDASKAALAGLTRHAALEGERRGVRVNAVVPGLVDTPLGRAATRLRPSRTALRMPLGRQATAFDVAYAVLYLLSDEAAYVTGQQLVVDGGLTTIR